MVYPSEDEFWKRSGAPKWSSGLYDGVVHLPAIRREDFGVRVRSLRHELMHAQLHATAGCTPVWLNEGAASYFGGSTHGDEWVRILRRRQLIDFAALDVRTVEEVDSGVGPVYGQSLAMAVFTIERASERSLVDAVHELEGMRHATPSDRRSLWSRLHPSVTDRDILDWLATRVFGVPVGPELDTIFTGAVCCSGYGRHTDFSCYGAPAVPGKHLWIDETRRRVAHCRVE